MGEVRPGQGRRSLRSARVLPRLSVGRDGRTFKGGTRVQLLEGRSIGSAQLSMVLRTGYRVGPPVEIQGRIATSSRPLTRPRGPAFMRARFAKVRCPQGQRKGRLSPSVLTGLLAIALCPAKCQTRAPSHPTPVAPVVGWVRGRPLADSCCWPTPLNSFVGQSK